MNLFGIDVLDRTIDSDTLAIAKNVTNISKGQTKYNFIDFITSADKKICWPYDYFQLKKERQELKKFECLYNEYRNDTLQILESVRSVHEFLGPIGNATKRREPGNCSLILFYTRACPGCALAAPHYNALPRYYPQFRIGAVDAFRFHSLNVDYGVISLPTILLFHNGRPVRRFNETFNIYNYVKFITAHTNLTPTTDKVFVTSDDFRGPLPNRVEFDTDYYVFVSWLFIFLCVCYWFTHTKYWMIIVDWMKCNWIEASEIQYEDDDVNDDDVKNDDIIGPSAIDTSDALVEGFSSHTGTSVIDATNIVGYSSSPNRSKLSLSANTPDDKEVNRYSGDENTIDLRNIPGPSGIHRTIASTNEPTSKNFTTQYANRYYDDDDDDYDDSVD